ncbi:hypothetical protein C8R45DRAFT_1185398 [Mycena sanguinolenta]|nr:hypothetical protein C8R45DRAFT_1185398 [Mycena sanguinolenta]
MGRKGKFNDAQDEHLNTYIDELVAKLDAGVRGVELTRWKQSAATKLSPPLPLRIWMNQRLHGFNGFRYRSLPGFLDNKDHLCNLQMIVRKFTNYYNNVYKKTHPDEPSAPELIKSNPLLKFNSVLSGRQLFSRECRDEISQLSAQRVADTGINEVAAYQIMRVTFSACQTGLRPRQRACSGLGLDLAVDQSPSPADRLASPFVGLASPFARLAEKRACAYYSQPRNYPIDVSDPAVSI